MFGLLISFTWPSVAQWMILRRGMLESVTVSSLGATPTGHVLYRRHGSIITTGLVLELELVWWYIYTWTQCIFVLGGCTVIHLACLHTQRYFTTCNACSMDISVRCVYLRYNYWYSHFKNTFNFLIQFIFDLRLNTSHGIVLFREVFCKKQVIIYLQVRVYVLLLNDIIMPMLGPWAHR